MTVAIRFTAYTDSTAGPLKCWPWTGLRNEDDYGILNVDGAIRRASNIALELAGRPLEDGQEACHQCDNPPCVNPAHLFAGTHLENQNDMVTKGRSNRGEKNGSASLTDDQVRGIRSDRIAGMMYKELCEKYGVTKSTVSRIMTRKAWTHVK